MIDSLDPTSEHYFVIRSLPVFKLELEHVIDDYVATTASVALGHPVWRERYAAAVDYLVWIADGLAGFRVGWDERTTEMWPKGSIQRVSEVYRT